MKEMMSRYSNILLIYLQKSLVAFENKLCSEFSSLLCDSLQEKLMLFDTFVVVENGGRYSQDD